MEKIPNLGNALKIVSLLEKDIFQEVSVHQLSKLIKLDYKTISKTVKQLVALDVLTKKLRGHAHFLSLNLNHIDIKTYLSFASYYNRLVYFKNDTKLNYLFEEIKKLNFLDSTLVLFGSSVLGQQTKSSDIDFLLITKNKKVQTALKSLFLKYVLNVDLNILTFEFS